MKTAKYLIGFIITCALCSCEEIGLVEKSKLDQAKSEAAQLKADLEKANSLVESLQCDNEELQDRLDRAIEERDRYLNILKNACHKSDKLEQIINSEDLVSFWDLEQAISDLRESLGYQQVYYNYSSQPFQSQETTVTKEPDYLFK